MLFYVTVTLFSCHRYVQWFAPKIFLFPHFLHKAIMDPLVVYWAGLSLICFNFRSSFWFSHDSNGVNGELIRLQHQKRSPIRPLVWKGARHCKEMAMKKINQKHSKKGRPFGVRWCIASMKKSLSCQPTGIVKKVAHLRRKWPWGRSTKSTVKKVAHSVSAWCEYEKIPMLFARQKISLSYVSYPYAHTKIFVNLEA